ncbi:MAG: MarR family transcriptional regulator [Nitrospirota bacterium]|nr:MarR family transcriptional regulator [Nitrospirota bacterium]
MNTLSPASQESAFFRDLIPAAGRDSEVVLNLIRAAGLLFAHLDRNFRAHGMSEAQFNVLVALEDHDNGMTMVEIARRMLVSRAGMSGLIRGLEGKGWVVRAQCPEDARAFRIQLTEAGHLALGRVLPAHMQSVAEAVAFLPAGDKASLIGILTRLRGHLACLRAHGDAGEPANNQTGETE